MQYLKYNSVGRYYLFLFSLTIFLGSCDKEGAEICIKGKLLIKGICMNYVIQDVDGVLGAEAIESSWRDPSTGSVYANVFALGSPCDFPLSIEEGQEFSFTVDISGGAPGCGVCQAYRPVPAKSLKIKVCNKVVQ
jgi:hypothetical protein